MGTMKKVWLKRIHLSMNGENYRILSTNLFNKKSYHAKVHCTAEKVSFEW